MGDFNLIVTTQRGNERACVREFVNMVNAVQGPNISLRRTRFPGLILGRVDGDPIALCRSLNSLTEEDPWGVRFVQRAIPIQVNVDAEVGAIKEAVGVVSKGIPEGASFKIEVAKRGSDLSSSEIIKESASMVQRRVNLEKPAYTVRVEIIDDRAGIALLADEDLLSVTKLQEKAMKESG